MSVPGMETSMSGMSVGGKKKVGRTRKILANISNNGNGSLLLALLVSHLMLVRLRTTLGCITLGEGIN